jgi:hypothetical protein
MTITTSMVLKILELLTDVAVPVIAGFDWPEKSTINIAVLMTGDSTTHESPVFLLHCTVEKHSRLSYLAKSSSFPIYTTSESAVVDPVTRF